MSKLSSIITKLGAGLLAARATSANMAMWINHFAQDIHGYSPADFGKSYQCRKIVRKNRLRAAELGGQRR